MWHAGINWGQIGRRQDRFAELSLKMSLLLFFTLLSTTLNVPTPSCPPLPPVSRGLHGGDKGLLWWHRPRYWMPGAWQLCSWGRLVSILLPTSRTQGLRRRYDQLPWWHRPDGMPNAWRVRCWGWPMPILLSMFSARQLWVCHVLLSWTHQCNGLWGAPNLSSPGWGWAVSPRLNVPLANFEKVSSCFKFSIGKSINSQS